MPDKEDRMQQILRMLLEMANGNFFFRLERSDREDNLEAMSVILNMLAEEIQESLVNQMHIRPRGTTKHIVQMCFLLDGQAIIKMTNQKACTILADTYSNIIDRPFESYLTKDSRDIWTRTWKRLNNKGGCDTSALLTFRTNENLLVSDNCYITSFKGIDNATKQTLVTIIHQTKGAYELEKELKKSIVNFKSNKQIPFKRDAGPKTSRPTLRSDDLNKIRNGQDFIMNNLEKDIPNLKDLALLLGTNEFKLKHGFKELYGVSVHQFLIRERLRKAKMLVQYSSIPLKTIAFMVGFKTNSYFSKTFSKKYGYTPSELRKKS
ncbi:AraC family transcriptional regulator [Snuella lapsa]|uniref:HTH araC/xylS-type domain-containing protein n=1 Tax=Snuella lapsa TaxID=870481 RepID=A0ABP6Y1F6_9FLAO